MSRERELLRRLLSNWEHPCSGRFGDLFDEVRELLSTSEPEQDEPVGNSDTLLEQDDAPVAYLYDLDAYCDHRPEQDVLTKKIPKGIPSEYLKNVRPLHIHPAPREPFVRLSEEEISEIGASIPPKMDLAEAKKKFARAIEDALEEKNK